MTWITSCSAPPLDHLRVPVLANYFLNLTFGGVGGHNDPTVGSFVHAFIVNSDKALRCYNAGRSHLLAYAASENRTMVLFEGIGEFETCVTTAKRCLTLADRMASHPQNPEIGRTQRRLLDSYERQIKPLRNSVEHIDEDIAKGTVVPGDPQMLSVTRDGERLVIGAHELRFVDLAAALSEIHTLAEALAARERNP